LSAQRTIKSYVVHNYGNLISAENPEFDADTKTWEAEIKSDYPIFLQDDKNPEKNLLRFIPIKRLGVIRFSESLRFIKDKSTPKEQIAETVRTLLDSWKTRTEKIVVQASANIFVRIPEFRHFFTPIDEIVGSLLENSIISNYELEKTRPSSKQLKTIKYLKLLEGLGFVRNVGIGFEIGNAFTLLQKESEIVKDDGKIVFDEELFRHGVISEILTKRYISFIDFFDISRLQPTIHLDSCIYTPSIEVEELVFLSKRTISENYVDSYGRPLNPLSINNILRRLKQFGAVTRDGKYWSGTENLLEDMLEIKKKMPELSANFVTA
jgi:hypothetical protein